MSFFFKPTDGWAADFIPFYWEGEYHLFYLKDYRNKAEHGEGTPWFHLGTQDFLTFTDYGEALPRGRPDEQDLYVFTGSITEKDGRFHIFYTGHNPHFRAEGRPEQAVMHAVSDDLYTWRKLPNDTFFAPTNTYEPHDWRDPFVFWNADAGEYWMLLAARLKVGPSRRRGCTALCASTDLHRWEVRPPFWTPGLYFTHECPDLFKMGDWWYLVYSEFSEACLTRYCMSRSLNGPWLAPSNDTFDGRAFYAAKTATDAQRRFIFGWNPTRDEEQDYRQWHWGGNLVVHEVSQATDGTLVVAMPESFNQAFHTPILVQFASGIGEYTTSAETVTVTAVSSFACAAAGVLPSRCKITAIMTFDEHTRGCGLMLRVSEDFESGYYIRLEPHRNRLVLDSWPRLGDVPFMVELERPLELPADKPVELTVVLDGTVCEVYAAGTIAMSTRLYNQPRGNWGVFVTEGTGSFQGISLMVP